MKCSYCGSVDLEENSKKCFRCGAPVENKTISKREKLSPYYYCGFMIWPEMAWGRDSLTYHIWLGDRHIGSFELTKNMVDAYKAMNRISDDEEIDLIEKLIRLTIGEEDFIKYEALNVDRKFVFTVTRSETPEFEEAKSLIASLLGETCALA